MAGSSVRVVIVAFLMNLGIAIAKFIGYFITGSASMLAEAIHSVADTSNQIFLYLGIKRSKKKADKDHPFGYGMEQYVWSFLVAILIFLLGAVFSLYEGIHKLMEPGDIEYPELNMGILVLGMFLEGYSSWVATKEFRKRTGGKVNIFRFAQRSKNQILVTVLFEDYAALVGLSIALLGNLIFWITGDPLADAVATLAIGVLLCFIAVFLYQEAKSLLVGESASEDDQKKIRKIFKNHPKVVKLKELLTLHLSSDQILVNAHVKFKNGMRVEDVEDVIDDIEFQIAKAVPAVYKIFIETHQRDKVEPIQKLESEKPNEEAETDE